MKSRESRLRALEDATQAAFNPMAAVSALLAKGGLSNVLAAGALLPRRDPWEMPDLAEARTGLGKLLREARQRQEERSA